MALPKLNVPKYKMKLPSDGRTVTYRPFLVKEEKLLLLATEMGEQSEMVTAIKDIISSCTNIDDVDKLPTFDIEYIFLQIRTKSAGEVVSVNVVCPDDEETEVEVVIPLGDIEVVKTKGHTPSLKLDDDIAIEMGYPSLDMFVQMNLTDEDEDEDEKTSQVEQVFKLAAGCVKSIADSNQVYDCSDVTESELLEWFEQLNSAQFTKIQQFFETMPKLSHTIEVENPETGVTSEVTLEGLNSFFA